MSDADDIDPGTRLAITKAWRLGICNCGPGAAGLGICPACDASPPTCNHQPCHRDYQARIKRWRRTA